MIWVQFLITALVIVLAGVRLARYGDVLGEKTGLGRSPALGQRHLRLSLTSPWEMCSAAACLICSSSLSWMPFSPSP
jgi:cation:H+ antiporter